MTARGLVVVVRGKATDPSLSPQLGYALLSLMYIQRCLFTSCQLLSTSTRLHESTGKPVNAKRIRAWMGLPLLHCGRSTRFLLRLVMVGDILLLKYGENKFLLCNY